MYAPLEWFTAFLLACLFCGLVAAFGTLMAVLIINVGAVGILPVAILAMVTVVIRNQLRD